MSYFSFVKVKDTNDDELDVNTDGSINTKIIEPLETTDRGSTGIPVFVQDQTTGPLDINFLNQLVSPSLSADTVVGNYTITVADATSLVAGQTLEIADTTNGTYFYTGTILSVVTTTITLDSPINRIYTTAASTLAASSKAMNVDGSVTPVIFSVKPLPLQSGDITRVIVDILDNADMDFETFGGLSALTNGIVMRINNGDGTYRNLWNFKTNGDIIRQAFDYKFETNNGGGVRSFASRMTWAGASKHGVAVRLDGALGESLEIIVQDDLTGLSSMQWVGQGSELQN